MPFSVSRFLPRAFRDALVAALSDHAARIYLRYNSNAAITHGPLTWDHHGMAARTSIDWLTDPKFAAAHDASWTELEGFGLSYRKRDKVRPIVRGGFHNEWNLHVACMFGVWALNLPSGDFVEVGSGAGIFSRCMMRYLDFEKTGRRFWLVDRWAPDSVEHLLTESEKKGGRTVSLYVDNFDIVRRIFTPYSAARLVQGMVPDCLPQIGAGEISFLYLDLNSATPEHTALEYLWPRVVPGGFVLSDDFGFLDHAPQRAMFRSFFAEKGIEVFYCPTGQGIAQKPPKP